MQEAIQLLFTPTGLFLILLGTSLGVFVGAIPGLTGTMLIALVLPLTYGANPQYALTLLISIYVGAISGGMVTATLLRMPGTPASIVTTFDGYPMATDFCATTTHLLRPSLQVSQILDTKSLLRLLSWVRCPWF